MLIRPLNILDSHSLDMTLSQVYFVHFDSLFTLLD